MSSTITVTKTRASWVISGIGRNTTNNTTSPIRVGSHKPLTSTIQCFRRGCMTMLSPASKFFGIPWGIVMVGGAESETLLGGQCVKRGQRDGRQERTVGDRVPHRSQAQQDQPASDRSGQDQADQDRQEGRLRAKNQAQEDAELHVSQSHRLRLE